MIFRIIFILAILIAAVLAFAATKPKTVHLQRSIIIKAPPQKIFALLDDFHNWPAWAPSDKDDPKMLRTFAGASAGVGAVSDWKGTGSSGAGRMAITESIPDTSVTVAVDFTKPFVAHNVNVFTLSPAADSTSVTWNFAGTNVYMMKLMSIFVSPERFMGKHFEAGLANLKAAAESP